MPADPQVIISHLCPVSLSTLSHHKVSSCKSNVNGIKIIPGSSLKSLPYGDTFRLNLNVPLGELLRMVWTPQIREDSSSDC